jgi:cupin fold WbuC family metalloprotein
MAAPPPYRLALDPPTGELALVTRARVDEAIAYARTSPRRRVIVPYHRAPEDPLHRMLNVVQPGSYIRPHRHLDPPKAEAWILLQGAALFFTFHDDGRVKTRVRLEAGGEAFGVDLTPGVYHSFVALAPDTVLYEVKTGPYTATNDKAFAPWAPAEGDPAADDYLAALLSFAGC